MLRCPEIANPMYKRHDSKPTLPGFGMIHPMERLLTTGADSQRRVVSKQAMMAACIPMRHIFFSAQESRPHEKQPQAPLYGPRRA